MVKYEAIFIIKNDKEEQIRDAIERIENIILSEYCEIISKEKKGTRKLAYEIKGNKTGYFYYVSFKGDYIDKNSLGKMSIKINTIEEVIKHIFFKMED